MRAGAALLLIAALATASALPAPLRADTVSDSVATLRARIRVDAVGAEVRARAWSAALEASAAPDTARAFALGLVLEAALENGRWGGDAVAVGERAVRAYERAYGDSSAQAGAVLITLGRLQYRRADYAAAWDAIARGLRWCERARGPNDRSVYRGVRYLANVAEEQADFALAERLYSRAMPLAESLYGTNSAEYGNALNSLAVLDRKTGRYAEARGLYERALAIRERALGPEDRDLVFNLNNLANLLSWMGDASTAHALFERDLRIVRKAYGTGHPYYAALLNNVADSYLSLGDTTAALGALREAVASLDSTGHSKSAEVARSSNNLGLIETALGDTAQARRDLDRGLAIREAIFGRGHPETALSVRGLGELALARGEKRLAFERFDEAAASFEKHFGPDDRELAETLVGRGRARRRLGDVTGALDDALRTERIGAEHLRLTARVLEERVALRLALRRPSGLDLALTLAAEHPGDRAMARRVWDSVMRSRALVLDEMAHRHHAVVTSADSATRQLADSLARVSESLARLLAGSDGGGDSVVRVRVAAERTERERIEVALAERSAQFRTDTRRSVAGYDSISRALDAGTALVAFAHYRHEPERDAAPATERYLAFVRAPGDSLPRVVPLGQAPALERSTRAWLAELGRRPGPLTRAADERRCRAAGARVRAWVWDPLRSACAGATRVLIVPDGAVQLVPFAALPAPGGGSEVEQGPPFHLLSAERDVVAAAGSEPVGRGLLAVGAPDFDRAGGSRPAGASRGSQSACEAFRALRFDPLPGARREVEAVGLRWRTACPDSAVAMLVGRGAGERELSERAPGMRVLHLATHGFFLGAACARRDRIDSLALEDPLLRAGVALAGANLRGHAAGDEDGILTAAEVATLNLEGLEWVVLSACESGRGEIQDGEGVLGLRRGFAVAGARTLVSSLWKVDDESTARWMQALYAARFSRHRGTAEAVQDAQRAVLRARRAAGLGDHPYFWAAFVAAGDWR